MDCVPDARRNIDAPKVTFRRLPAKPVASRNCAEVVEDNYFCHALENKKAFGFRRVEMSMRPYVRSAEKDVQKTVRIVGWT